jgi:hypothetical protein
MVMFKIKGSKLREYHGKHMMKSRTTWISNCEYESKILKVNIPNFSDKKEYLLSVKMIDIDENQILSKFSTKDDNWENLAYKIQ